MHGDDAHDALPNRPRPRTGVPTLAGLSSARGRQSGLGACCLRVAVATSCLLALVPDTVAAHGAVGRSGYATGLAVGIAVALGLTVGLLGVILGTRRTERIPVAAFGAVVAFGFLLLGLAFLLPVAAESPPVALGGLVVGGGVTKLAVRATGSRAGCPCLRSTDVAAVGVAIHRVVEGVALGVAVAAGGRVGLLGVGVVAGHTAVEAGLLGAAYGTTSSLRGVAAVVGVQLALVGGVAAGLTALATVPSLVETVVLAVAGSALVVAGAETARARPAALT